MRSWAPRFSPRIVRPTKIRGGSVELSRRFLRYRCDVIRPWPWSEWSRLGDLSLPSKIFPHQRGKSPALAEPEGLVHSNRVYVHARDRKAYGLVAQVGQFLYRCPQQFVANTGSAQ